MSLIWCTDVHFNFLKPRGTAQFGEALRLAHPNATGVVVSGDIAEAQNVVRLLQEFVEAVGIPVAFVLGNHDYYNGSTSSVHTALDAAFSGSLNCRWLDRSVPVTFPDFALVGVGGWYDGRFGDARGSRVVMSDFRLIRDLSPSYNRNAWEWYPESRDDLLDTIRTLAAEAAATLRRQLWEALDLRNNVLVATHYPPFAEATWHEGKHSNEEWLPWFSCHATGEVLRETAEEFPDSKFLVLCGHTHGSGVYQPRSNLKVLTGAAEYYRPGVAGLIDTESFNW